MPELQETPAASADPTLVEAVRDLLDEHDRATRQEVVSTIAALRAPDRSIAGRISPTDPTEPTDRAQPFGTGSPRDPLYARLYRDTPQLAGVRTEDTDQWIAAEFQAIMRGDRVGRREAQDRANLAYRRASQQRATIIEGALATDPTGVLVGAGGDWLSQPATAAVMIAREAAAVVGSLANIVQMLEASIRIPTGGAATAAKRVEGQAAAQGEPGTASVMLRAEALTCYMKLSREFVLDSPFNATGFVTTRAGMAIGLAEDTDILTTNGVSPNASGALAGGNIAEASSTVLTGPDLSTLYRAVSKANRSAGCAWLGNTAMMGFLDQLVDANGRQLLRRADEPVGPIGDQPNAEGSIYGYPVFEVPSVAGDLIFGNIRQGYAVGRRSGIEARISDQASFSAGLVEFMIEERYDGNLQEAAAIKEFQGIASVA